MMEAGTLTTSLIPTDNAAVAAAAVAASNEAFKLFPLDQQQFEISINVRPGADKPLFVTHVLRRPTEAELIERDQAHVIETVLSNKGEYSLPENNDAPDLALWQKIALAVVGYKLADGRPATEPRSVTAELMQKIPASHKLAALSGLYASECEIVAEDDAFDLENETLRIKQSLGTKDKPDFVIEHVLRVPTESERTKFLRNRQTRKTIGVKKGAKVSVTENLKTYIDFYNDHFVLINGVSFTQTLIDSQRQVLLAAIDAQYKRQVVECLMKSYEAALQD